MKFFPKLIIAFFILASFVLLLTDKSIWPSYYDLPYMGWAALVCAMAIFLIPQQFKFPLALILLLNGLGDLGLYQLYLYGFEFDKVIHFLSPAIAAYTLIPTIGWKRTAMVVVVVAFSWELFEFLSDAIIKTHLFGVYRHQIFRDTVMDFGMNILGVATGSILRYYKQSD